MSTYVRSPRRRVMTIERWDPVGEMLTLRDALIE